MNKKTLALYGGVPIRQKMMPGRRLFGEAELAAVSNVFQQAWNDDRDFSYQGLEEERYTSDFCAFQKEKGYADAVATGTAAIFVSIQSLQLPPGSPILVSPVTDPGSLMGAILLGHPLVIADSIPDNFNIGPEQFEKAINGNVKAAILTHLGGHPLEMDCIMEIANAHDIKVIEDCSQAHGAYFNERRVGCFGAIGVFSTMFSKAHATGGCGGLIYTQDEGLFRKIRYSADRGKPLPCENHNQKNPAFNHFPALNLNLDEISCSIGRVTLGKVDQRMHRRREITKRIDDALSDCKAVNPSKINLISVPSPFFHTIRVDPSRLIVSKKEFCQALLAEGIDINPDYRFVVSEWPWITSYLQTPTPTPNATKFRETSFNLLFHERYTENDVDDVIKAIIKVDSCLSQ